MIEAARGPGPEQTTRAAVLAIAAGTLGASVLIVREGQVLGPVAATHVADAGYVTNASLWYLPPASLPPRGLPPLLLGRGLGEGGRQQSTAPVGLVRVSHLPHLGRQVRLGPAEPAGEFC